MLRVSKQSKQPNGDSGLTEVFFSKPLSWYGEDLSPSEEFDDMMERDEQEMRKD